MQQNSYKLREYQRKGKSQILKSFQENHKRLIFCQPTGSGKTVTFADIAKGAVAKGTRTMIICDRKELISQACEKLMGLGLFPTIVAPGHPMRNNDILYIASVDTLKRRQLPQVNLIIVDEAHKQTFDNILLRYIEICSPYIIGATATPLRTGAQKPLDRIYTKIVETITIPELIDLGFLVPAKTFGPDEDFSSVKQSGGDFDFRAMYDKMNQNQLYDGVVDNYLKFSLGKKAICFNVNVEHSMNMCRKFNERGISAEHLDGKTATGRRRAILRGFKRGDFKVLCNCGVLATGYDEPSIECVIVNRATMSLPLWLQMCGRGSRIFEGKGNFVIIDQGANWKRHGLWHFDREWSLNKKKKRDSDGVAPVKMCESCEAINHSSAQRCKECGEPFKVKKKELKQAEFREIKEDRLKRGMIKKPDASKASIEELKEYAEKMGYNKKWAYVQHAKQKNNGGQTQRATSMNKRGMV